MNNILAFRLLKHRIVLITRRFMDNLFLERVDFGVRVRKESIGTNLWETMVVLQSAISFNDVMSAFACSF